MKNFANILAATALAANGASAHYIFEKLTAGTTQFDTYQYIRENTNYNSPVTDLTSNDLRCNVGADGATTDTIEMTAGEAFAFTLDVAVYHQGPISMYMSKAPSAASEYDGSGEWFKIKDIGPDFSSGTAVWDMAQTYSGTIPTCVEDGDYLLRIQSLAIHNPWPAGIPQFYVECAQVTVSGGSGTYAPATALIPGAFSDTDPGYTVNIYSGFTNYTVPGPAVITC
ncbi:Uu.00g135350.m01.CDS01 [Anthostomella pinea]|uniref:lytic cellulose monooxygenase (C4-dehydrogenating) n=1 Tax=Anthostomella pinea TaxID=933095 RepID=A0AAI8YL13_9PEZI|nr:Uu.00g135350.m01.CDS01 [Anthostomella pinea]